MVPWTPRVNKNIKRLNNFYTLLNTFSWFMHQTKFLMLYIKKYIYLSLFSPPPRLGFDQAVFPGWQFSIFNFWNKMYNCTYRFEMKQFIFTVECSISSRSGKHKSTFNKKISNLKFKLHV